MVGGMYGKDPEEEPTGEMYGRMPPRRSHPRDAYDSDPDFRRSHPRDAHDDGPRFRGGQPRDAYDGDPGFGRSHPREDFDYDRYYDRPAPDSAARLTRGERRRPASGRLRSAGRRVGNALGWVGILVIAPLIVGILAGAVGQHIGL